MNTSQIHESAIIDPGAQIGAGTRIWHFCHISAGAVIGQNCSFGQNCFVADGVAVGDGVKVQNNVSVYDGVRLEDDVFVGPSVVFTNVRTPRAEVPRKDQFQQTIIQKGATIGANVTLVCPLTVGRYAFVAAGSVVTADVPDHGLVQGNPARRVGWVSRHGLRLPAPDADGVSICPETGLRYREVEPGLLRCLDSNERTSQFAGTKSPLGSEARSRTALAGGRKDGKSRRGPHGVVLERSERARTRTKEHVGVAGVKQRSEVSQEVSTKPNDSQDP